MSKFDPYRRWLDVRPDEVRTHYRLLGLPLFESDPAAIEAATEQRMAMVRSFESDAHAELARRILDELAVARACLLDPPQKAAYDEQIRSELRTGQGAEPAWLRPGVVLAGLGLLVTAAFLLIVWLGQTMFHPPVVGPPGPRRTLPVRDEAVLDEESEESPLAEVAEDTDLALQARDVLTSQFEAGIPPPAPETEVEAPPGPTAESPEARPGPDASAVRPQVDVRISAAEIAYPVRVGPIEFLGPPENLGPVVNSSAADLGAKLSQDNLTLLLSSGRFGGQGGGDLWMCTRASDEEPWGAPVNLGANINSSHDEGGPALSADGCTLVFESNRPGGQGRRDIWMCTRDSAEQPWNPPVNPGRPLNGSTDDGEPAISGDALTLMFQSYYRPGGMGHWDLWVSRRDSRNQSWEEPANLGSPVNGPTYQTAPGLSPDRLVLVFGQGGVDGDLWIATRAAEDSPWTGPVSLGPAVNSRHRDWCGSFSPDGRTLLFSSDRTGGRGDLDLYQVPVRLHAP